MASLDKYRADLEGAKDKVGQVAGKAIKDNEQFILDLIKNRLYNTGIDGAGNLIGGGRYAEATIRQKEKKGQITSHFTLRDTGAFYSSMRVFQSGASVIITANDVNDLIGRYGEEILMLNDNELDLVFEGVVQGAINREMRDELDAGFDIDIDLM